MTITRRSTLAGIAGGALFGLPLAARAEGTLEATKKRGTFRVGVTQAPPWFSKDPKTGEWTSGLGISMGKAMADKLGVKMETVEVSWGNSIAALQGDRIGAAVPYYGAPLGEDPPDWSGLTAPVLGHFAEDDGFFPSDATMALGRELEEMDKDVTFILYPKMGHAFCNEEDPLGNFDEPNAQEAWARTVDFLHEHLD